MLIRDADSAFDPIDDRMGWKAIGTGWDTITLSCRVGVLARMRGCWHVEECCGIFRIEPKAPMQGHRCGIAFSNQETTQDSYTYRDDLMGMISDDVETWSRTLEKSTRK